MNASNPNGAEPVLNGLASLIPNLEALYKDVHAHPELSMQETRTAGLAADRLRAAGYEVTTGVGKTGVVGLLRNGDGPTVMLRADMDALPIEEATGLPYASKIEMKDRQGNTVPVGHMCGHDLHVTWLAGATALFAQARDAWRGTLMAVFQPGEETAEGAQAMIDDGLFKRFPEPVVRRRAHRSHHFGCRQPANPSVRARRAWLDAAIQHRSRSDGGRNSDAAANHRLPRSRRRRGGCGHRRCVTSRHQRECHSG